MCGIAGFYSSAKHSFSGDTLGKMTNILSHRGPDAEGFYFDEYIGLGHRRLSIIDLSAEANQPLYSQNEQYVIIYNGEVYNYKEIATEIQKFHNTNFHFKTTSDTEIILEAFSIWKEKFVKMLNGMYAIAIYDKLNHDLFLFRDRMGKKPLYYHWSNNTLLFASEIKSLLTTNYFSTEIDNPSVSEYFNLGFVPSPNTIYKNIKQLEAASYMKITAAGSETTSYWSLEETITQNKVLNEQEALSGLEGLLKNSVKLQLQSDVPYGVFLSGGVDSSLITALACQVSDTQISTFSIGFYEDEFNESAYAKKIANHLRTRHHEFIVTQSDAAAVFDDVTKYYDMPFGDASAIPTMLVSQLAKKHVTVCLSGEGSDELFHGYGAYLWAERLNRKTIRTFRHSFHNILNAGKNNRLKRISYLFDYDDPSNIRSHIFSQEQYYFSAKELSQLIINAPPYLPRLQQEQSPTKRILTAAEEQAFFDLKYYLQDDLLAKVDRASMRFSLETRVPYLDYKLIEFASNISPELKYKNRIGKYILKQLLYKHIPKEYFNRPKQGFAMPLKKWLKKDFKYLIDDYLSEELVKKHKLLNYEIVNNIKKRFFAGEDYLYNRIWQLIIFNKWLKETSKQ